MATQSSWAISLAVIRRGAMSGSILSASMAFSPEVPEAPFPRKTPTRKGGLSADGAIPVPRRATHAAHRRPCTRRVIVRFNLNSFVSFKENTCCSGSEFRLQPVAVQTRNSNLLSDCANDINGVPTRCIYCSLLNLWKLLRVHWLYSTPTI